jgi:hypothetical protein
MNDARWTTEALRLFHRYQLEIVEAWGLCPWAEPARRMNRMRERVMLQTDTGTARSVATMAELALDETVEVAVLIYPRLGLAMQPFERFVATLREDDARTHPLGAIPFAMAAFHPDARLDASHAERLIPYLRRTPDPTIQIVRTSVLDRVRGSAPQGTSFVNFATFDITAVAQPPLRERIARANLARVESSGAAALTECLDDIRRDRERTYAALTEGMIPA